MPSCAECFNLVVYGIPADANIDVVSLCVVISETDVVVDEQHCCNLFLSVAANNVELALMNGISIKSVLYPLHRYSMC